jgi:signal transduction histidine kinase
LERAADNVDLRNRHLQTLKQQTTHLEILLEDMLNMLRLDRDSEFAQSRIYLNGVVASVIESQEVLAEQKGHEIIYERAEETESDPLVVMGDPVYLGHAVTNILKNAINYTPDPGTIRIRTRRSDGHAIIEIEDRGIGIAQEDLPHIFDRFFRADIARNADGGGTGLGLSIAKKIIEQHEGTIEVESAPSEGSTFRVVLPLAGMSEDQEETIS